MSVETKFDSDREIDGLLHWWQLAGVDSAVLEEPLGWLSAGKAENTPGVAPATPVDHGTVWPDRLDAFHQMLGHSPSLPELQWPGPSVLPVACDAPKLAVIVDMPDDFGMQPPAGYLNAAGDALLTNMLRAIGVGREEIYLCALSLRRPPTASIPADLLPDLTARMRHHLSLIDVPAALLLGDTTSRALIPANDACNDMGLHVVNHAGGNMAGIGTFHPGLMLTRSAAKAECWRILQRLTGVWAK